MAIIIYTKNPNDFLDKIYSAIDKGDIDTWSYNTDKDLTHSPDQWKNKAWFRPITDIDILRFGIVANQKIEFTYQLYGLYHGRFIETLLTHFNNEFIRISTTAKPIEPDLVKRIT
jgi:hypothetical protein